MSELSSEISKTVSEWLYEEIRESHEGKNRALDEYETAYQDRSFILAKRDGHQDRMHVWVGSRDMFTSPEQKDEIDARIIFGGLMQVSGAFRKECYITASDQKDYLEKRIAIPTQNKPIGINVGRSTAVQLKKFQLNEQPSDLDEDAQRTWATSYTYDNHILNILDTNPDSEFLPSIVRRQQRIWLGFTVRCIERARMDRGGELGEVPVLKPMTISNEDQSVIKPFTEVVSDSV